MKKSRKSASTGSRPGRRDDSRESAEDVALTPDEGRQVRKLASVDSYVVHEVIRRQGDDELGRPTRSLCWSGFAAGIAISSSALGQALLQEVLPPSPWRGAVAALGYTLGFLIVILGRLQLFTESTLSATIPVATRPTWFNLGRLARLWGIVLAANLLGTCLIAALLSLHAIGYEEHLNGMIALSRGLLDHGPLATLSSGIPAGFLLAAVAWALPAARGQEFWIILFFTYFIGLGRFPHVVAGSAEAWLLAFTGQTSFSFAILGFMVPALAGNVIGGALIFALLAHAQVSSEIETLR